MLAHAPACRRARPVGALLRPATSSATRRRTATARPPRAEADYPPGPSRLATTVSWGIASMINSAVFASAYDTVPALQILASRIEEVEAKPVWHCMVKLGTLLASPVDLLLLTIAISLIELMRLMGEGDE